ncbi:MAG TPA: hypothetical protein V6D08_08510 [Candidatus Obscuribacterales bacterium]
MPADNSLTPLLAGQQAAHGTDGSSLSQLGRTREEIWFRKRDAELIAKLKPQKPSTGSPPTSPTPVFAAENSELFNRRVQHEASRNASPRGSWFTEPLAHSREDAWFRQRDRELIEQMRSRRS